jgi:hypothetical protein
VENGYRRADSLRKLSVIVLRRVRMDGCVPFGPAVTDLVISFNDDGRNVQRLQSPRKTKTGTTSTDYQAVIRT